MSLHAFYEQLEKDVLSAMGKPSKGYWAALGISLKKSARQYHCRPGG